MKCCQRLLAHLTRQLDGRHELWAVRDFRRNRIWSNTASMRFFDLRNRWLSWPSALAFVCHHDASRVEDAHSLALKTLRPVRYSALGKAQPHRLVRFHTTVAPISCPVCGCQCAYLTISSVCEMKPADEGAAECDSSQHD